MTVEPMTPDLAVATLRGWADHMRAENAILQTRAGFIISADVLDAVLSTISTLTAERDQHATAYIELHGQHVAKMIELADARSALKRAEAERDAAVARERERCAQIVCDRIMAARLGEIDQDLRSNRHIIEHAIRHPTPTAAQED